MAVVKGKTEIDGHGSAQRIEASTEVAIMGLRQALAARKSQRLLIVCDPTLDDPLHEPAQAQRLSMHSVALPPSQGAPPRLYLVDVEDERRHEAFVNLSLRLAVSQAMAAAPAERRPRSVCAWLLTDAPAKAVAHAIAHRSGVTDEQGRRRLLRIWDPRTTQHLPRLFPGQPAQSWIADAAWGYVDSFGRWQVLPPPLGNVESVAPLWPQLRLYGQVNAVLQRLAVDGVRHGEDVVPRVLEALHLARSVGLREDDDQACFAAQRIERRAPLEHAPRIAVLLDIARDGGGRYQTMSGDLNEDDWNTALAEIPSAAAIHYRE